MESTEKYSLFYCPEDGKLHIGDACTEENEALVGNMGEKIYQSENYHGEGKNLTLSDFHFQTTADIALIVPDGSTVILEGKNELKVVNDRERANAAVLYSNGSMTITGGAEAELRCLAETSQGLWSRCICARFGNLSIEGGTIYAIAGSAGKCGAIYAGGRFREVPDTGRIRIRGGKILASAKTNAIRASAGKLFLEPPKNYCSVVNNAREYTGSSLSWNGETLTQEKMDKPVMILFEPEPVVSGTGRTI
ncbi:MAG: hypothetical protein LUG99_19990 [Lachnospiraceae bacterium]|nr:hypothetical protein [Lachnospiraceae bacterium]